MTLTCPHCRQPFTLQAVAASFPDHPASVGAIMSGASPSGPWRCPVHGRSKTVPAGISKKSGKPYNSFAACDVTDCPEKQPFDFHANSTTIY